MKRNKVERSGNAYIITLTEEEFDIAQSNEIESEMLRTNRSDNEELLNRLRAVAKHNKGILNG